MNRDAMLAKLDHIKGRIGKTPLVSLRHPVVSLFAKNETTNMMGSIKDRAAFAIIYDGVKKGIIDGNTTVIEASSGNFAMSCSVICKLIDVKFIAVVDPVINASYLKIISFFAHDIIMIDERDHSGGFLLNKLDRVRTFCATTKNAFWTNQYENPQNFLTHYNGTAVEICNVLDHLDYAFIAVASGGTISGISCRLKEHFPNVKVIGVDAEGSVIFGGKPKPRYIPGMGSSIVPPLLAKAQIDDVVTVTEPDTLKACHRLFLEEGLFLGGSSGTVYHAVNEYFRDKVFSTPPNVLFICPDRGTGYIDNLYNQEWIEWFNLEHAAKV